MFMPPEQASKEEIEAGEVQATQNVQIFTVACLALWFSPHVVEWTFKLF